MLCLGQVTVQRLDLGLDIMSMGCRDENQTNSTVLQTRAMIGA